jgi:hypothetical protein
MENLSFIVHHFFISFFSGCIINCYLSIFYSVLKKASILPSFFKDISFSAMTTYFGFIVSAILLGILVEGICQFFIELYFHLDSNEKIIKRSKNRKTFRGFLLHHFFMAPTFYRAVEYYSEKKENPMKAFNMDLEKDNLCYDPLNKDYDAVYMCSRIIEKEDKITNIYRYRDRSFMVQMIRLSFSLISIITIVFGSLFLYFAYKQGTESFNLFCSFFIGSLVLSVSCFLLLTPLAFSFGKRYIRDVGQTYVALKLNLPVKKTGVS